MSSAVFRLCLARLDLVDQRETGSWRWEGGGRRCAGSSVGSLPSCLDLVSHGQWRAALSYRCGGETSVGCWFQPGARSPSCKRVKLLEAAVCLVSVSIALTLNLRRRHRPCVCSARLGFSLPGGCLWIQYWLWRRRRRRLMEA